MEQIEEKMREEAKRLLAEKKVDVIVGYEAGTLPLTATPCFIAAPEEAGKLVWNRFCTQNLAKFVHDLLSEHKTLQKRLKPEQRTKKVVGVVARGCTTRSLLVHLQEKQYAREEIVIIGVPCRGYVDRRKLAAQVNGREITGGGLNGETLAVKTAGGDTDILLSQVIADNCLTCRFNNPLTPDVMAGEPALPMDAAREYAAIGEFEKLSPEERWAYFRKEMAKCIRCYACRNACPSCYCRSCFVEQSQPQWIGVGGDESDTMVFQLMRLYHMVGRCVDCGFCSDVCPLGVDLRKYLKKLDKDDFELFGHRAGVSLDEPAPLSTFTEGDPEKFIFHPAPKEGAPAGHGK